MADRWQSEATASIRSWGFNTYKSPDMRYDKYGRPLFQSTPGTPDLFVFRGGRMTYVEVKDGYTNFPFNNFEQTKKDYIAKYCQAAPYGIEVWLWLALGSGSPNYKPEKSPRITWLVPIAEWYKVEEIIKPHQLSLPYRVGKGYNTVMQNNRFDAVTLLEKFMLKWKGAGLWALPDTHPFYNMYVNQPPLPLYELEASKNVRVQSHPAPAAGNHAGSRRQLASNGSHSQKHVTRRTGILPAGYIEGIVPTQSEGYARRTLQYMDYPQSFTVDTAIGKWCPI